MSLDVRSRTNMASRCRWSTMLRRLPARAGSKMAASSSASNASGFWRSSGFSSNAGQLALHFERLQQRRQQRQRAARAFRIEPLQRAAQQARGGVGAFRIAAEPEKIVRQARLGRLLPVRRSSTFWFEACSSVISSTGVSDMTQVSLLLPPCCMEMKWPPASGRNARQSAGHDAITVAAGHQINAQADRPRRRARRRPSDGAVENSTRSCATNRSGSNSMRRRSASRSAALSGFSGVGDAQASAERRLDDQLVEMFEDVLPRRIPGRTTTSPPTAVSIPRRADAGTGRAETP